MRPTLALLLAAVLASSSLVGCTRLFKLSPVKDGGIDMIYQGGREVAVAEDATARVLVSGAKVSGDYLVLRLAITNKADARLDVMPTQLRVLATVDRIRKPLKVHDPDRLLQDLQFQQGMVALIGAIGDASAAGPRTVTSTTTGTAVTRTSDPQAPVRRETYQERTVTRVNDPAAEAQAAELRRQRQLRESELNEQRNRELSASLLRATTLFKNEQVEGLVYVQAEDGSDYEVTVPVGSQKFTIRFLPLAD